MPTKPRHYLIDGYNLMHALGVQPHRLAEAGLQAARGRLLNYLADRLGDRTANATVVFDAVRARSRLESETEHRGIAVRFARGTEADDVIEELIRRAARPEQLAVVSNDLRLVRAAERRGCQALRCAEFIDELEAIQAPVQEPGVPGKEATRSTSDDVTHWLAEFGHLDRDPTLGQPPPFSREKDED